MNRKKAEAKRKKFHLNRIAFLFPIIFYAIYAVVYLIIFPDAYGTGLHLNKIVGMENFIIHFMDRIHCFIILSGMDNPKQKTGISSAGCAPWKGTISKSPADK